MVIIGGGNVRATGFFNVWAKLNSSPTGAGIVYLERDNADDLISEESGQGTEEVSMKVTIGDNDDDLNATEDSKKRQVPLWLCVRPNSNRTVYLIDFVKVLRNDHAYSSTDFVKGSYNKNQSDGSFYKIEDGTIKLRVNVNTGRQDGHSETEISGTTNKQDRAYARDNGTWSASPDFQFYADMIEVYAYKDGHRPGDCGTIGTIESSIENLYNQEMGTEITITANPSPGCHFVKWVDKNGVETTSNSVTYNIGDNHYTAEFGINPFTMNSDGIATFSCPKAFRYDDDTDLMAYPAMVVDGKVKLLTGLKGVPNNHGAILIGTPNKTYNLPPTWYLGELDLFGWGEDNPQKFNRNQLKSTASGPVTADGTQYALGKRNDVVGFYRVKSGATIPQGKAYIVVTESAKDFIGFADDDVTNSIAAQIAERMSDEAVYNLQGQRVADDYRGLVIKNGKKFINQ